jgi:rhodanese-related sulfurtransferase
MKNLKIVTLLIGLALLVKIAFASNLEKISPQDAYKLQQDNKAVIVDVREMDEINAGKIKGTLIIPLSIMEKKPIEFEKLVSALPRDKKILVYCRSGRRSGIVGEELLKQKFDVLNLGGFEAWKSLGLPTE